MLIRVILIFFFFFYNNLYSESYIKASNGITWDKANQIYSAVGNVEFRNDEIESFSNEIIASYILEDEKEIFSLVKLFDDVEIFYQGEVFTGDKANYNREKSIIILTGNVTITSPERFLSGDELVVDLEQNTRVLKTKGGDSIAEALIRDE